MSLQQDRYLAARATGATMATACAESEIPMSEARLIENAIVRGELALPTIPAAAAAQPEGSEMANIDDNQEASGAPEPFVALAADTLRGDVRDAMLSWFKGTPKPWSQMGEREQRDLADAADRAARTLVKEACKLIAAGERPCIVATLTEYREKDGVEAKLKLASRGDVVAALHEACGREVLIVTSGAEEFMEEEAPAAIDADQPGFPNLGQEYDEAA